MNENTLINNCNKRTAIFNSLMEVKFHAGRPKTLQEELIELKEAEAQGKLRIYVPETNHA